MMGQSVNNIPVKRYKYALYFAMQQLSHEEYLQRLPSSEQSTSDTLALIEDMGSEEALETLHEAVLGLEPRPISDFFEIGYPAKFRSRLIVEEGWKIAEIRRYGLFARNLILSDETIIEEIGGALGNSGQTMKMSFHPNHKSEIAEVRRRVDECLSNNDPWRAQINFVLSEIELSGENRKCYIQIMNPSSGVTTVYLAATNDNGALYVPTYQVRIPEHESKRMYFGVLGHTNAISRPLDQVINEFYDGKKAVLLSTLQWGGYEARDVAVVRRLGLKYKTYRVDVDNDERRFQKLDNHEWEACGPIDPLSSYFSFLQKNREFTSEVIELYSSRWDGHVVELHRDD